MKVVGTAGHVDHGKSTLVSALTGIDPDRLKEEKAREMTIELGFAWMNLPDGEPIGIIDVPGHRDFIENMLAGVGGIDAVIFVIAADEGIMPQTREHLAILDLLAVEKGVIALTKSDLVTDYAWLDLVKNDIRDAVNNTSLEEAAIIPVSAKTGEGLNDLVSKLQAILKEVPPKQDLGKPRLSVDRVFSIQGFGTVVTGTLLDGKLSVGDDVVILPSEKKGRIRGLQTHKSKTEVVLPGSRAAVNISGLDVSDIKRGDLVTGSFRYIPSRRLDAYIKILADSTVSLKHNDEIKIFHLAAERMARIRLLGKDVFSPGESGYVQLEFTEPLAAERADRFIIRYPSPGETIGGGEIIQTDVARRYKRFSEEVIQRLMNLHIGSVSDRVLEFASGLPVFSVNDLTNSLSLSEVEIINVVMALVQKRKIIDLTTDIKNETQKKYMAANQWNSMRIKFESILTEFHTRYPLRSGMTKEELKSRVKLENRLFNVLLDTFIAEKYFRDSDGLIHLRDHNVIFSTDQLERIDNLQKEWNRAPYSPPGIKEVSESIGEEVFNALTSQGQFMRVSKDIAFRKKEIDKMLEFVESKIKTSGSLTVSEFRDHFNTSRKYALAFLEFLDQTEVTVRDGDSRILKNINK